MATTMYCPESPAHSECAYVPESPARSECVYEPESPMERNGTGLIARLLNDMKKTQKHKPVKYNPIYAWRSYIKLMMIEEKKTLNRARGNTENDYCNSRAQYERTKLRVVEIAWNERKLEERKRVLKSFITEWRDACPTPRKIVNNPLDKNIDYFRVVTKLKVDKSGHVNVDISTPLLNLHEKYFQKLMKPPIDEYAQVLTDVSYPEWIIERMVTRHSKKEFSDPLKTVQESLESKDFRKPKSKKHVSSLNKFKLK